jgi:hypothetical protein
MIKYIREGLSFDQSHQRALRDSNEWFIFYFKWGYFN